MVHQESANPRSDFQSRRSHVRWTVVFAVTMLLGSGIILNSGWTSARSRADTVFLLPFVHLVGALIICRRCGLPRGAGVRAVVAILHVVIFANTTLVQQGSQRWAMVTTVALLLRVLIIAGWAACALAVVVLIETLRRGNLRWSRWSAGILKVGLACGLLLVPLEITAKAILASRTVELSLPAQLEHSDDINIATLGGSTMLGFPYAPHYGIGSVVVWQLQQMYPERDVILNNIAQTGANLEQAISRLSRLNALPDILVVYSGHNEFFHNLEELSLAKKTHWAGLDDVLIPSAFFRLLHGIVAQYSLSFQGGDPNKELVGEKTAPQELLNRRVLRYQQQLKLLFSWAKTNQVTVVFCSPSACESDFEPNVSLPALASEDVQQRIGQLWKDVRELQRANQWQAAAELCERGLLDHPDFAEFHFRLGECLQNLGRHNEARPHFRDALNKDQFPIRCMTDYRDAGLAVAREDNVATLDSSRLLLAHSESGYLDDRLFLDGVHPNLKATYVLGMAVLDLITRRKLLPNHDTSVSPTRTSFPESTQDLQIDAAVLSDAYDITSGVLTTYSAFRPYDTDRRLQEAEAFGRASDQLKRGEIQPGQEGTESLDESVVYGGIPSSGK